MVINAILFFYTILKLFITSLKPLRSISPFGYDFMFEFITNNYENYDKINTLLTNNKKNINKPMLSGLSFKLLYKNINFSKKKANTSLEQGLLHLYLYLNLLNSNKVGLEHRDIIITNFIINLYSAKIKDIQNLDMSSFGSFLFYLNNTENTVFYTNTPLQSSNILLSLSNIKSYFNKYKFTKLVFFNRNESLWKTKFPVSFLDKLININFINRLNTIFFIRNFKVYNKGRYSRNRQYYRTGVYWCLYVNIIAVVGMYYWFYRFTMNFGYLWWFFFFFFFTVVFTKFVKFNLFNIYNLSNEITLNIKWVGGFVSNMYIYIFNTLKYYSVYFFKFLRLGNKIKYSCDIILLPYITIVNMLTKFLNFNNSSNIHIWSFFKFNYYLPLGWIYKGHKWKYFENLYFILFK